MTKFKEWPDVPALDVLVGGTPCQSFSVAGLRAGLDDPRGNLMLTYACIARRYRPRWLVWENVPGVLSSEGGRDFASLLGVLSGRDIVVPPGGWQNSGVVPGIESGYGLAWRVLDAQYFGVPQRRRRVFVVGCLGDWRGAAAVLLEFSSLRGDPPPRRTKGKRIAPTIEARARGGGAGWGTDFLAGGGLVGGDELAATLRAGAGSSAHHLRGDGHDNLVAGPEYLWRETDQANAPTVEVQTGTLNCDKGQRGGILVGPLTGQTAKGGQAGQEPEHLVVAEVAPTLCGAGNRTGGDRPPGTNVETVDSLIVFDETQITSPENRSQPKAGDPSHPLQAEARAPTIAFDCKRNAADSAAEETSPTLRAMEGKKSNAGGQVAVAYGISDDQDGAEELVGTMTRPSASGGGHPPAVALPAIRPVGVFRCPCGTEFPQMADFSPSPRQELDGWMLLAEPCPTCKKMDGGTVTYFQEFGGSLEAPFAFKASHYSRGKDGAPSDISPPVLAIEQAGSDNRILVGAVAFKASHFTRDKDGAPSEVVPPLSADADKGDQDTLIMTGDTKSVSSTTAPPLLSNHLTRATDTAPVVFEARFARNGRGAPEEVVPPLKAQSGETGKGDAAPVVCVNMQGGKGQAGASEEQSPTLGADTQMHAIAVEVADTLSVGANQTTGVRSGEVVAYSVTPEGGQGADLRVTQTDGAQAITSKNEGVPGYDRGTRIQSGMQVRRLTPRECERLQGFPDDYTLIQYRGKPAADGPRYKALGNSMARPVMHWIGVRIDAVDAILKEAKA